MELLNFEMEITIMLQAKVYNLNEVDMMPIIKNCLGREGLQFIQTLTNAEIKACKSTTVLFNNLKENSGHSIMK